MSTVKIVYATMNHLESWMELVELVRWNFPGLETAELLEGYKATVIKNIRRSTALCATDGENVAGLLLFSPKHNMLSCMAVHPDYRRQHIATQLIQEMVKNLDPDRPISVTTFREDDPKGIAPRALYTSFGFIPAELCIEENYPTQRFVLLPSKTQRSE